jgi:Ca2+-binding RTX toxin-like protein
MAPVTSPYSVRCSSGDFSDNVSAGNGNDTLLLAPYSQLIGGNGNDTVFASLNDSITLGNGTDTINAGANDTITLGTGGAANTIFFGISPNGVPIGQETIYNFHPQNDQIEINASLLMSFAAAQADAHQVGADTVITIDATDSITLKGVAVGSLVAHDFAFV